MLSRRGGGKGRVVEMNALDRKVLSLMVDGAEKICEHAISQ